MIGSQHIHVVGTCSETGNVLARLNDTNVIDRLPDAAPGLEQAGGPEAVSLFALPQRSGADADDAGTITWFSDVRGPHRALADLPEDEAAAAASRLKSILASVDNDGDAATRAFLRSALNLRSKEAIRVIDGRPVLVDWGMVPVDVVARPDGLKHHAAATIGPYLPDGLVPDLVVSEAAPEPAAADAAPQASGTGPGPGLAAAAGAAAGAGAGTNPQDGPKDGPPPGGAPPVFVAAPVRHAALVALAALSVLFLVFVIYILWPGNLIYPRTPVATISDADARAARREANETVRRQITELRGLATTDVCQLDPATLESGRVAPPVDPSGAGTAPGTGTETVPGSGSAETPPTGTTPAPTTTTPATTTAADGRLANSELLSRLDEATVFVIGLKGDGVATGSGFMVSPRHAVTNYHVVEEVREGSLLVSNSRLPQPRPARVIQRTDTSEIGRGDFALLELAAPVDVRPLPLSGNTGRLSGVVAAGYPSFILSTDRNFIASFKGGDLSMLQNIQLAVTTGTVTADQRATSGIRLLAHSATISPGNSGGPLADLCGRAVGVNTFARTDSANLVRLNFALGADDLAAFLERSGVPVSLDPAACSADPGPAAQPADAAAGPGDATGQPASGNGGTTGVNK